MKKLIFIIAIYLCSCSSNEKKWYAGGTLHQADVIQWQTATNENRLATCADFVSNAKKVKGLTYENTELMKQDALNLMHSINDVYQTSAAATMKANEIAASVIVVQDFKK